MNTERATHLLQALVEAGHRQGLYPGAAFRVFRADGKVLAGGAVGSTGRDGCTPVTMETVWDLASLTKPLVTATAILILAQEGAFHLGEEVGKHLPGCSNQVGRIPLRSLLTHTSGLKPWEKLHSQGLSREAILEHVKQSVPERPIGDRYAYSDLGYILLGEVVTAVAGIPLDRFAAERIFGPLGMRATRYRPPAGWAHRLAATYCPDRKRDLCGEVHDGNCAAMGGVAGHAGLFSTVDDLQHYGTMLLRHGETRGNRLLAPAVVRQMLRNHNPASLPAHGLGWFMKPNGYLPVGDFLPDDTAGHTGFTGTSLLLVPSRSLGAILLTNRVLLDQDAGEFLGFRRRFHNAVALLAG